MDIPQVHAPGAIEPARRLLETFLAEQVSAGVVFEPGESLQLFWIWLQIEKDDSHLQVTAPRFHAMPMEFVADCSDSLNLIAQQRYIADSFEAQYGWCSCMQYAIVIDNLYSCTDWYMHRTDAEEGNSSGWYVGAEDSQLDVDSRDNLRLVSLWELFCRRPEIGLFFLLPTGWHVHFYDRPVVYNDGEEATAQKGSFFDRKYQV